jgi:hypothetical protein
VAGQGDIGQVEFGQQGVEVGGESVVVVAVGRLAGLTESAPVIGDDPVARLQQNRDLLVPGAAAERVAVDQDNGPALAVVLVIQIDIPEFSCPTVVYGTLSSLAKWRWLSESDANPV